MRISAIYYPMLAAGQIIAVLGFIGESFHFHTGLLFLGWALLSVVMAILFYLKNVSFSRTFLIIESVLTAMLFQAIFKLIIYDNSPNLARLGVITAGSLLGIHKIFSNEIVNLVQFIWRRSISWLSWPIWINGKDIFASVLIGLVLWVPDAERVVALAFVGEQLHHWDFFLMSPGLAWLHGGKPYVDVISQYGVGVVGILTELTKLLGGFTYLNALLAVMGLVFLYFVVVFIFIRRYLGGWLLALAGVLVLFRLQMCHYGVSPLVWIFPSSTPIRFGMDIGWIWALYLHGKTNQKRWLMLAAVYSGFAPFWMTSTGACVLGAFGVYLFFRWLTRADQWLTCCGALCVSVLSLISWYTVFLGSSAFDPTFYRKMIEYIQYFAHGHAGGVLPLYESLKYRHWWAFAMAVGVPIVYVLTLITAMFQIYLNRQARHPWIWLATIALYGLMQYQYFVVRSAVTSYYVAALAFVLVSAFWVKWLIDIYAPMYRREVSLALFLLAGYALMTNHNFTAYPNYLNWSSNPLVDLTVAQRFPDRQGYFNHLVKNIKESDKVPLNNLGNSNEEMVTEESFTNDKEVKEFASKHLEFSADTALIQEFFPVNTPVPLLSSFETAILLKANRPPFFYHTPLVSSRPMRVRIFPTDAAHSPRFTEETIAQLEKSSAEYVVMEKIFLQENLPPSYDELPWKRINDIVRYIKRHYQPVKRGQFLVVMKRMP